MSGDHRGVSVFDKTNPRLRNFDWFKIPADTPLHRLWPLPETPTVGLI
jgi:hypothetical protein